MPEMTAGEIRELLGKLDAHQTAFIEERRNLEYGVRRIRERIEELDQQIRRSLEAREVLNRTLSLANSLPRGRRVTVNVDVHGLPKYNPHRRLAIMERSFL
jgi:hypothetical protein